jgi:hypothetical protein
MADLKLRLKIKKHRDAGRSPDGTPIGLPSQIKLNEPLYSFLNHGILQPSRNP